MMKKMLFSLLATLSLAGNLTAQKTPVKVLLLGCFHFDNPGLDVAKFESADIMSAQRQSEIAKVVANLAAYRPDKIFVEVSTASQAKLDQEVASYKRGEHKLSASEVDQLGYRLAEQLNLPTLYAADERSTDFPMDSLVKVLQENRQGDMLQMIGKMIDSIQTDFNQRLKTQSIQQMLLDANKKADRDNQVGMYFEFLKAGNLQNHVGAYLTSEWWRRNMMIYGNILKQLTGKEERILIIFGSGHTALLEVMMQYQKNFEIVQVADILK